MLFLYCPGVSAKTSDLICHILSFYFSMCTIPRCLVSSVDRLRCHGDLSPKCNTEYSSNERWELGAGSWEWKIIRSQGVGIGMDSSQINLHEGIRETVPNLTHTQLAWRNSVRFTTVCFLVGNWLNPWLRYITSCPMVFICFLLFILSL